MHDYPLDLVGFCPLVVMNKRILIRMPSCHAILFVCSLSECYFAGKGAALVLPPNERLRPSASNNTNSNSGNSNGGHHSRRVSASGSDIQQHLQSMFYLLRPEETLKMVS
jgi:protein phosphatase slingshot